MIQVDDLLDIFEPQPKRKLPELVRLRSKAGWTRAQMAVALRIDPELYAEIEFEKVKNDEIVQKAKDILKRGVKFSSEFMIPAPDFKAEKEYRFIPAPKYIRREPQKPKERCLRFIKSVKGANNLRHYLLKNQGGSVESFSSTQLLDYQIKEV